jgi:outer membrane immunogenic protein
MQRKLIVTAGTFLLLSSSAWAIIPGFYVGLGMGPENGTFTKTSWISHASDLNVRDKTELSGNGIFGSIYGGYGYKHERLYLGTELNVDVSTLDSTSSNNDANHPASASRTEYEIKHSVGISFLPGFYILPATLTYARIGYANGNFKINTNDVTLPQIHNNLNGIRYGVGIKQTIYKQISIGIDYSTIAYQSTAGNYKDSVTGTAKRTRIIPETNQIEFGLIYDFI